MNKYSIGLSNFDDVWGILGMQIYFSEGFLRNTPLKVYRVGGWVLLALNRILYCLYFGYSTAVM